MPPRITRTSVTAPSKPRKATAKKNTKRSLNAFSIANAENPERAKVRQHRLGEVEDDDGSRKRRRIQHDEDDDEEEDFRRNRGPRDNPKDRFDELDISEGEDSEGHAWQMGQVDDEDDSEVDSDEAFGSSDEERFEGFTFRGSASAKKGKQTARNPRAGPSTMNLDEDDMGEAGEDPEDDDDSLGEDAVDLATMLDQTESDDESVHEATQSNSRRPRHSSEEDDFSAGPEEDESMDWDNEGNAADTESSAEEDDEDSADDGEDSESSTSDDEQPSKDEQQLQLQKLISSMQPDDTAESKREKSNQASESQTPSHFGLGGRTLTAEDLLPTVTDKSQRKALKLLRDSKTSGRSGVSGKVAVPLPKRQQDKLDRIAANEKAKATLERWVDTVKNNRRAEHLSFPIKDPNQGDPQGTNRFNPISRTAPMNDLEGTIQNILQESGLAPTDGKTEEDKLQAFEELESKKIPLDEILARRAELRQARELLFREERRAKRIKKIKSKAYRRVHRKERERAEQEERDALAAAGVEMSDEEREKADRRRAEERMGAKHRESKWAKGVKKSGKGAWDEEARAGVTEMARRNEELRKRIAGKEIQDDNASNVSSDDEADDDSSENDQAQRLRAKMDRVDGSGSTEGESRLSSLAFMKRAEAARKAQNDEDLARFERELAGHNSDEESGDENATSIGRQIFGPSSRKPQKSQATPPREFEEPLGSDEEKTAPAQEDEDVHFILENGSHGKSSSKNPPKRPTRAAQKSLDVDDTENPWLTGGKVKSSKAKNQEDSAIKGEDPSESVAQVRNDSGSGQKTKKNAQADRPNTDADGWTVVTYQDDEKDLSDGHSEAETEDDLMPFVMRNQELVQKAFAGDDVVADFEKEKKEIAAEEDEQEIDTTLPGWGSWTGDGLSKREKKRTQKRTVVKQPGIKPAQRKDAKLDRVIINQKRQKKNVKYMASQLPHPFENRQQYERSLRLPVGPEWTTKETFQRATKPRVMVKQGIIDPLSKPTV